MGARQSTSTNRYQYGNDKHPKAQDKENESTKKITMNIIDLNDDCLMKIFKYLDLQRLFNVAVANEWLRSAAVDVYNSQFSGKIIRLKNWDGDYDLGTFDTFRGIYVYGLKTCLRYLRCFGSSIKNLQIDYRISNSKWRERVHQYIDTYCVDSLNEIRFWGMPTMSMDFHFVKPFCNVRCVRFSHCILDEHLPEFGKWFPNLRHLELKNVCWNDGFVPIHFQHLEHLCIKGIRYDQQNYVVLNAANLLHSNRQLQSLELHSYWKGSISIMLDMIKDHSYITKLHIEFEYGKAFAIDPLEINRIANEHSSMVELNLKYFKFTADDVIALIDQLKSLEVFEFYIEYGSNIVRLESNLNQNEWILTKRYDFIPRYVRLNRKNPMSKCMRMKSIIQFN